MGQGLFSQLKKKDDITSGGCILPKVGGRVSQKFYTVQAAPATRNVEKEENNCLSSVEAGVVVILIIAPWVNCPLSGN